MRGLLAKLLIFFAFSLLWAGSASGHVVVANSAGTGERLLSGVEGIVTGGSSRALGQNLLREMGVSPGLK
jgi:hypothetical protein